MWLIPLGPFTGYLLLRSDKTDCISAFRLLYIGVGIHLLYSGVICALLYIVLAVLTDLIERLIGILRIVVYIIGIYGFYSIPVAIASIISAARRTIFEKIGKVITVALLPLVLWGTFSGYVVLRLSKV